MRLRSTWQQAAHKELQKALPGYCAFCLMPAGQGLGWCQTCFTELPWNVSSCEQCAEPLDHPTQRRCGHCLLDPPLVTHAHAALLFQASIKELLHDFKFKASPRAGMLLVELMLASIPDDPGTALVAVPMHRKRARERGFNQARWLAEQLAKRTGLVVLEAQCNKLVASQRSLNRHERAANLHGAFSIKAPLPAHITLIDDVITTGATINALANVAQQAGATRIDSWAVARTPLGTRG
ncbi:MULTISPECIES: ComF family protein [Halomonas]|uniref:ComF family protein n=1 Tax=Halomonas TaxID=2745 RepID=UPI001D019660|nr:ComF family protein [Halomonas citrativorans]